MNKVIHKVSLKNVMKSLFKKKWRNRDSMIFFERLSLYISAGLTIDRALHVVALGVAPWQHLTISKMRQEVIAGSLVSKSISKNMDLPETIIGIIEHGESSGELGQSLSVAKTFLEKSDELTKKCLSALAYPVIIGIFACLLTIGLVRGVMPQIIPMLKSLHVELPLLTRIVIAFSDVTTLYGIYIALGLIFIIFLISILYKKMYIFKRFVHEICIHTPVLGSLVRSYSYSFFLQSCGLLVCSGIPIPEAFSKSSRHIQLYPLREHMLSKTASLYTGVLLSNVLSAKSLKIPAFIPPLISAGEMSGTLGISLTRSASIIDRDIDHLLKKLTALIEPIMMAGMGIVVGSIALSIMMPIYNMSRALQQ